MIEEFFLSDFSGDGKLIKAGIMEEWNGGIMGRNEITLKPNFPIFHYSIIPIFQVLDIPSFQFICPAASARENCFCFFLFFLALPA